MSQVPVVLPVTVWVDERSLADLAKLSDRLDADNGATLTKEGADSMGAWLRLATDSSTATSR